jgi:branched-chain amino acid transport system ATP-binding protein
VPEPNFLDVSGLCVSYGRRQVLFDVSLAARPRGAVAVLGRNGAGKTTLLRTIVGELESHGGSITLGARHILQVPTERRIRMGLGYVPQEHSVFGRLSVRENLAVGALSTPNAATIDRVLTMFPKLGQRLGQPAGTLSGGERKMLAMGRALLSSPKLLLLDEPAAGFTPQEKVELMELVGTILERGITVFLIEHDMKVVMQASQRIVVLDHGEKIAEGTPNEVRGNQRVIEAYLGKSA